MKILVIGGTGMIGSQVTRDLLSLGHTPRVLTRSQDHAARLPEGAEASVGDLGNPRSLPGVFEGVEAAFMAVPVNPDETRMGVNAVEAATNAGCRRFVYSSVMMPRGSETIPHFASKIPVEEAVRASGMEFTILRPSNFYQNDLFLKDVMLQFGVYTQPIGDIGINRVDTRDIADAGVNALTQAGFTGQTYDIGGPQNWTGERTAAMWSKHLGRDIRYSGNNLSTWAQQASKTLPDFIIHDFRIMYQFFQENGFPMPDSAQAPLRSILGHEPRGFEAFVEEMADQWVPQPVKTGV